MSNPTAYVINLDRRPDRWQRTQELWSEFFELVRVPATDMPHDGARGCKLSHVQLAERVLADEPMVIVLEDDALPTEDMRVFGVACIEEAWKYLDIWDAINLSPLLDLSTIGLPRSELFRTDSTRFLRSTYSHSTNAVIYNRRTLPILTASLSSCLPVDMYIARNCRCQWTHMSLLATQSFEDSDIRQAFPEQAQWYARSAEMLNQFTTETESCDSKASSQRGR